MSYYIDFKNEVIILLQVFPDYYPSFSCVGSACRHNCCIGWEIDIDEDTLSFYRSLSGPLGQRLKQHITSEDTPHFVLNHDDRCPFLNESNLCDLILSLGEDHLCQICRDHPRFRNNLPGRTETGIGLCCEAAGKLILGKSEPVKLCISGQDTEEDEIIEALRPSWIQGLSVLGGEPCEEENERVLLPLLKNIWWEMPEKDIWLYSGYTYEQLQGRAILRYVDVLVDGPFLIDQKDISLAFRGSRNQQILRLRNGVRV